MSGQKKSRAHRTVVQTARAASIGVAAHRLGERRPVRRVEPGKMLGTELGAAHRWGVGEIPRPIRTGRERRNALPIPREDVPRSGLQRSEVPPPFTKLLLQGRRYDLGE